MVWVVFLKLAATSVEESVLLLPILEKEENENGGADWPLPPWRKKEELSVERDKCGGYGGGEAVCGFVWWLGRRRERGKERLQKRGSGGLVFLSTLDLIFSSLRPSIPHLFIGGGRGQHCLHKGKIPALDSVGKNPNRWLKVGILSSQFCKKNCLSRHV